ARLELHSRFCGGSIGQSVSSQVGGDAAQPRIAERRENSVPEPVVGGKPVQQEHRRTTPFVAHFERQPGKPHAAHERPPGTSVWHVSVAIWFPGRRSCCAQALRAVRCTML